MEEMEFSVPCLFGLEGLAGDELRRLDIQNVRVENGRVLFSGDVSALAKANICLRTGERVLIVLADFKATTFPCPSDTIASSLPPLCVLPQWSASSPWCLTAVFPALLLV